MRAEAIAFLHSLTPEQRRLAASGIDSPERLDWHYIPRERRLWTPRCRCAAWCGGRGRGEGGAAVWPAGPREPGGAGRRGARRPRRRGGPGGGGGPGRRGGGGELLIIRRPRV